MVRQLRAKKRVIEPLSEFHKDEVRQIGAELGLPAELTQRHPFPGPGLAIRILCANDAYMEKDFAETQVLCRLVVNYAEMAAKGHALLNRIEAITTEEERNELSTVTRRYIVLISRNFEIIIKMNLFFNKYFVKLIYQFHEIFVLLK